MPSSEFPAKSPTATGNIQRKNPMIELEENRLIISFPEIHKDARAEIELKRTFRIPDDGQSYPLPPGFQNFELRHVEDYAQMVPEWQAKGGVMMSMYQAEALWLNFDGDYPIALKIGTGKINAIDGLNWKEGLTRKSIAPSEWRVTRPNDGQNYVVIPQQPWLDGYCVGEGVIAQFVAMPLGQGATAEEQINGTTEGGIQLQAFPLKAEKWEAILEERRKEYEAMRGVHCDMMCDSSPMGLAPGGRMKQHIYKDKYNPDDWDTSTTSRCWIHICNSEKWEKITKEKPPHAPYSMEEYTKAGLPWFEYYCEDPALKGSKILNKLKTTSDFKTDAKTSPLGPQKVDEWWPPF